MHTIRDVAARAGVSVATVSRVLNNNPTVDPTLAQRVHETVRAIGYEPNRAARTLRRQVSTLWGLIVSDVGNPFFTSMVRGIEDVAQNEGYSVVLCNSDEDLDKERKYIEIAVAERMAGVIIAPASETRTSLFPLTSRRLPVVTVDRVAVGENIASVRVDNNAGARLAIEHLLAEGFSRIGFIGGPPEATSARERLNGYLEALARGSKHADPMTIAHADFREDGGYAAMRHVLEADAPPEAVLVSNNLMAIGALRAIRDLGLEIPHDVAIVAWDDQPWATLVDPALTVVVQPVYDIGRRAGELLLERIADPDASGEAEQFEPELIVRRSSLGSQ